MAIQYQMISPVDIHMNNIILTKQLLFIFAHLEIDTYVIITSIAKDKTILFIIRGKTHKTGMEDPGSPQLQGKIHREVPQRGAHLFPWVPAKPCLNEDSPMIMALGFDSTACTGFLGA